MGLPKQTIIPKKSPSDDKSYNLPAFCFLAFMLNNDPDKKYDFNDMMTEFYSYEEKVRMICWLATVGKAEMGRIISTKSADPPTTEENERVIQCAYRTFHALT